MLPRKQAASLVDAIQAVETGTSESMNRRVPPDELRRGQGTKK
jgi:hypothetical protein